MKVIYPITLDVKKTNVQKIIRANQGEGLDRKLKIRLVSGNETLNLDSNNQSASLVATKPDGTNIYNAAKIKNGKVYIYLTTQTVAAVGDVICQLKITSVDSGSAGNGVIYSAKFAIDVEAPLYSDSEIESTNEFSELVELTQKVEKQVTVYSGEGTPDTDPDTYEDIKESDFYYDETNKSYYYATSVTTTITWKQIYNKTEIDNIISNKTNKVYTAVITQQGYLDTAKSNYSGVKANDLIKGGTNDNRLWCVDYVSGDYISATQMKNVYVSDELPASTIGAKLYNVKDVVMNDDTIYYCASVTASETTPIQYSYTWNTVISADDYYTKSQVYTKSETYMKSEVDAGLAAKQNTIDSSHKLSADNVDDSNTTNKFTNATEKAAWNSKQNALIAGSGIDITSDTISFKRQNVPNNLLKEISGYYYVSQEDLGYSEGVRISLQNSHFNYALAPKAIVSENTPPTVSTDYADRELEIGQIWINTEDLDYNGGTYIMWYKILNSTNYTYVWLPLADASNVQNKLTAGNGIDITSDTISAKVNSSTDNGLSNGSSGLMVSKSALGLDNTVRTNLADTSANNPLATKASVDAKQDKIDSTHKIDSDNVDDSTSTNKFVSAAEKAAIGKEPKYELIKTIDISDISEPVSMISITEDEEGNAFACDDILVQVNGVKASANNSRLAIGVYKDNKYIMYNNSNALGTTAKTIYCDFGRKTVDLFNMTVGGSYNASDILKSENMTAYTDKLNKVVLLTNNTFSEGIINVYGKVKY